MKKTKNTGGSVTTDERLISLEGKVDKLLDNVASKADLNEAVAKMASKSDLEKMASKSDLEKMASKSDLEKAMAKMATKADLKNAMNGAKADLDKAVAKLVTKDHFDRAVLMLVMKYEFDEFKEYVYEKLMTTATFENRFDDYQDCLLEMRDHSASRILFQSQHADLQDDVAKHEYRIRALEEKI